MSTAYTTSDLLAFHEFLTDAARSLMVRKNNDYAGSSGTQPFKNFELCSAMGLTTTEVGMAVRLSDKIQRLSHLLSGQKMLVTDESLRDTLLDIINYTVLIGAYVDSYDVSEESC